MKKLILYSIALLCSFQQLSSKDYVILQDRSHGFFSNFLSVLGLAHQYETYEISGFHVCFTQHSLYYDPKKDENWWNNYFEPIKMSNSENNRIHVDTGMESAMTAYFSVGLNRYVAHALIQDHIHVKSYIKAEVEEYVNKHFKGYMVGVHYRGTDKFWSNEAKLISYDEVANAIRSVLVAKHNVGNDYRIFVATDDLNFLNHIKKVFKGHVIYQNCIRSKDARPIHYVFEGTAVAGGKTTPFGFQLGKEALIDALLLSKCHFLLRTNSNLSLCSTYFNPDLPEKLLQ